MKQMGRGIFVWAALFWAALLPAQIVPGQYIVELKPPPAGAGKLKAGAPRLAARLIQDELRNEVVRRGGKVTAALNRVSNALITELPEAGAKALESLPAVRGVYPVRKMRLTLDRAPAVHRVREAWEAMNAPERAGAGVKIAILDTGIDTNHPGFKDDGSPLPPGFPKFDSEDNRALTNGKVIVARAYGRSGSAQDGHGHGTAVAMIAAGIRHQAVGVTLSGLAPGAWLGNYKVLNNAGETTNAIVLRALEDAVVDGMDVVNMSLGDPAAPRPADDPLARAIDAAVEAGVIVVVAAGNDGSDPNTINSPGTAASAITVGSLRTAVGTISIPDWLDIDATLPTGMESRGPITAPVAAVADLDGAGLGCVPLPPASLAGRIALILRGDCTFEQKLANAEAAGALAAVIYSDPQTRGRPRSWLAGTSRLPAMMVGFPDGSALRSLAARSPGFQARLVFTGNALSQFSSTGPGPDLGIKPDILALGGQVLTAGEVTMPLGRFYARDGYLVASGTSFSCAMAAGAAALVKAAHPGLTGAQYRSLIVNSAAQFPSEVSLSRVQQAGAGVLDASAAVRGTVAVSPVSLSLGAAAGTAGLYRDVQIANLGPAPEQFTFRVAAAAGAAPTVEPSSILIENGKSGLARLAFPAGAGPEVESQGFLEIRGERSGSIARVSYWRAPGSAQPAYLTLLYAPDSDIPGSAAEMIFRVTDAAGVPVRTNPSVTVRAGDGQVLEVASIDADVPGAYRARLRLGDTPGMNLFEIAVDGLPTRPVVIDGSW